MAKWTYRDIPSQKGKVALVTGANSGIGYHTTRELALSGARVIMACRSADKAAQAAASLRAQIPRADLELLHLDLASLNSVRAAARSVSAQYDALDLLINNAGVMALPLRRTEEGFEMQFGVNHLGHFVLTALLVERLLAAPAARVVTVSSMMHRFVRLDFENLNAGQSYRKWGAYNQSKLANLLFAYELQRRLQAAGASAISLATNPGYVHTNLAAAGPQMEGRQFFKVLSNLGGRLLGLDAAQGALSSLYAATAPQAQGGDFIQPHLFGVWGYPQRSESSQASYDPVKAERLWQLSEELTGVEFAL